MQLCRPLAVSDQPHITIIGAGLIGLSTADALETRGAKVTVVDARSGVCEGTSFSNSGMIHPSQALSWESLRPSQGELDAARVTVDLGQRSRGLLLDQIKRLGLPERADGCLQIQPDIEAARAAQVIYNKIGIRTNIVIDPIDSFGQAACQFPDDSSGDARAFGCALAEDLKSRGVEFIFGAETVKFRASESGFSVRNLKQDVSSDHLVLAAGIHTVELLSQVEIRMRLKGISGAAADFALPADRDDFPACPVMDTESRSAMTIFKDRLRISGGWGLTDPSALIERWRSIAPGLMLRLGEPISTWTGVRPISPVGRPYISETSIPKLWVNTGHGHMGWTLCAGSGELLSEMILEGRDDRRFAFSG